MSETLIYLIRHGEPEFAGGERRCIGSGTDVGLSEKGVAQAKRLKGCLAGLPVYSSGLRRALQTAEAAGACPKELAGMREMYLGEWENLTFAQIERDYPQIYARRSRDWSYPPPGAESYKEAAKRALAAIESVPEREFAVVTHDGVIRALLCELAGVNPESCVMPRQPYASVTVLKRGEKGCAFGALGKDAEALPSPGEIEEYYELCRTPERVKEHCRAVSVKVGDLARRLGRKGCRISAPMAETAGLLHDLLRARGRDHPQAARRFLAERGYLKLGNIIGCHHDLKSEEIDEKAALYLADVCTRGTEDVSIEERFGGSLKKCRAPEAAAAHRRRYAAALNIQKAVERVLNG